MNVQSSGRHTAINAGRFAVLALIAVVLFAFGCSSDPTEPPTPEPFAVSSVNIIDENKIRIAYNRNVDEATAGDVASYTLMQDQTAVTVTRADVQSNPKIVILSTETLQTSEAHRVTIAAVKSAGGDALGQTSKDVVNAITSGTIVTWVGTGDAGFNGDGKLLENSMLYLPSNLTFTSTGCYILDWNNHRVRLVDPDNTLRTVIGTDIFGDGDLGLTDRNPPGPPGIEVNLNHPTDIDELPDGRILHTSWHTHKLRIYDPNTGLCYVSSGEEAGFGGDGGDVRDARYSQPPHSVVMPDGTIYVLDQRNQRIRKIDGATNIITTVAGTGVAGFSGDGGSPVNCQFNFPAGGNPRIPAGGLATDTQGRLYISDTDNHRVRRIDFNTNMIETVAGDGTQGYSGDGGAAISASLNNPRDIQFGPDGRLYLADELNNRIRAIDLTTGVITTVAGNGEAGFSGDGGPATEAKLDWPGGVAFDAAGYLYIVDTNNHRIRRVIP